MALSIFDDLIRVGTSSIVSIADGSITSDPIFTAIAAHRSAHNDYVEAMAARDKHRDDRVPCLVASIQVGMYDDINVSEELIEGGVLTITLKPTGKKLPLYVSGYRDLVEEVPKDLLAAERDA
jgi:hypothetical protein